MVNPFHSRDRAVHPTGRDFIRQVGSVENVMQQWLWDNFRRIRLTKSYSFGPKHDPELWCEVGQRNAGVDPTGFLLSRSKSLSPGGEIDRENLVSK